jgi:hypothetical protein
LVVEVSEQRRGGRGRALHRLQPLPQNGKWIAPLFSASAATASTQKSIVIQVCNWVLRMKVSVLRAVQ